MIRRGAMDGQRTLLEWRSGDVPVSARFDDPYFSVEDGLAETRHVFFSGNDLPARLGPGFTIAELGFGTGLNFLTAWQAWDEAGAGGALHFTSFEAFPLDPSDMARALRGFAPLADRAGRLVAALPNGGGQVTFGAVTLDLIVGDARVTLPRWDGRANAWFLDGFAPARNPELWEPGLMREVFAHTVPGGTAATYTAAGAVRRSLAQAGFAVQRVAGYGRKRHMTRARRSA